MSNSQRLNDEPVQADTIEERQQQIVEEFGLFDDWMGRYEFLIDLGRELSPLDEQYKTDEYRIKGCQSQVWVHSVAENGCIRYEADSDALITKGLVALLIRVLDEQPPEAVAKTDLHFIDDIGLQEHLSPNRKNGLNGMVRQMKQQALVHSAYKGKG